MTTNPDTIQDFELLHQINEGNMKVYEQIIRRYNPLLYKIGRSYSFNHQDTEDLMQETYIDVYRGLAKFENRSSFKTWISRIMLNQCYHKRQAVIIKKEITEDELLFSKSDNGNSESKLSNTELSRVLETAINEIPENYRIVFALRELNGLNVAETAHTLDISENNVKVRFNRAKALLREKITRTYSSEELFEFNCIYCDGMVSKVMSDI
ncbi:MAG: sigma-70 family RNA polymerase sigma factor [Ginsengibacter sp.]